MCIVVYCIVYIWSRAVGGVDGPGVPAVSRLDDVRSGANLVTPLWSASVQPIAGSSYSTPTVVGLVALRSAIGTTGKIKLLCTLPACREGA